MPKTLDKKKFIEAKIEGLNNKEAAIMAGSTPKGAKQAGWRLSTNLEDEQSRTIALKKYGITWDILIAKYTEKMNAKRHDTTGDIVDDQTTQLTAMKELAKMLGERRKDVEITSGQPTLLNIPIGTNEVELQRIILGINK